MSFNTKEQEIIKWGLQNGKSKEEVKQALTNFRTGTTTKPTEVEQPSLGERLKTDINEAGARALDAIQGVGEYEGKGSIERGLGAAAAGAGAIGSVAYDVLPETARKGLDYAGDKIKEGFKGLTDSISKTKLFDEIGRLENEGFVNTAELRSALGMAGSSGEVSGAILGAAETGINANKILNAGLKGADALTGAVTSAIPNATGVVDNIASKITPKSPEIMNRVARLKPTDANKFKELAGKTHGEYLTETGNFGAPDTIIKNEAAKFTRSLNEVDTALEKLPGTFEDGSISDALDGLVEKAKSTSGNNVKSPFYDRVTQLQSKLDFGGLTMKEINEVKRLYEKNVKLGYNKLVNGDKVEQATNIDNALRQWQVNKAEELGFKNIAELNKQTQLSKFLIDKLGDQLVGQSGLNGITLTDWIVLSELNPLAVGSVITKKFLSSKRVQSKVAEWLNRGNEIQGDVKADIGPSRVPRLPAPTSGVKKSFGSDSVIPVAPTDSAIEIIGKTGITPKKKK